MALVDLPSPMYWPAKSVFSGAPALGNFSMTTTAHYIGYVFHALETDTITKVGFRTGSVNAGSFDVRIETVDLATGFPSGTLWASNTNFVQSVLASSDNTFLEVTLTAGASVNKGDLLAVVIRPAVNFTAGVGLISGVTYNNLPINCRDNNGTPVTQINGGGVFSVCYQNAGYLYMENCLSITSVNTLTFNNTSTPDVYGNKFTLPFSCKVRGAWFAADLDGDVNIKLYDSDGVTVLATQTNDADIPPSANPSTNIIEFPSEITLDANTAYYLGIEPSSGTNISVYSLAFPSADIKKCFTGGSASHVEAKDPSGTVSWTEITTQCVLAGLVISSIDSGNTYPRGRVVNATS